MGHGRLSFGALIQGLDWASAGAATPVTAKAPIVNATMKDFSMFVSPLAWFGRGDAEPPGFPTTCGEA
jgi:hypothetical protein